MTEKYIKTLETAEHIGCSDITAEKLQDRAQTIEMEKEDKLPERLHQAVIDLWVEKFRTGADKIKIVVSADRAELQMNIKFTVKEKEAAKTHAQLLERGKKFMEEADQ